MRVRVGDDCIVIDGNGTGFMNGDIVTVEKFYDGQFLCSNNNRAYYMYERQLNIVDDCLCENITNIDNTVGKLKEQIEKLKVILKNRKDQHPPINGQEVMDRRSGTIGYSCGEFSNTGHLKVSSSKNCRGSIMHFAKWDIVDVRVREKIC